MSHEKAYPYLGFYIIGLLFRRNLFLLDGDA